MINILSARNLKAASNVFGGVGEILGGLQASHQLRGQARNRRQEGEAGAQDVAREGRAALAFGNVAVGTSGLTGSGSAEDVLRYMATEISADSRRVRHRANREAIRLENRARGALFNGIVGGITKIATAGLG